MRRLVLVLLLVLGWCSSVGLAVGAPEGRPWTKPTWRRPAAGVHTPSEPDRACTTRARQVPASSETELFLTGEVAKVDTLRTSRDTDQPALPPRRWRTRRASELDLGPLRAAAGASARQPSSRVVKVCTILLFASRDRVERHARERERLLHLLGATCWLTRDDRGWEEEEEEGAGPMQRRRLGKVRRTKAVHGVMMRVGATGGAFCLVLPLCRRSIEPRCIRASSRRRRHARSPLLGRTHQVAGGVALALVGTLAHQHPRVDLRREDENTRASNQQRTDGGQPATEQTNQPP